MRPGIGRCVDHSDVLELQTLAGMGAAQRDRERLLPWDALDDFVATGLWTITVPQAYGGPGLSAGTLAKVTALVSAADGSLGQIPQNHF